MEKRFTVMSHEYMNTGGNAMVSIFAVYDSVDNVSRWVIANEVGFNWQTADTVSNIDFTLDNDEMIAKIVIGSWDWNALTCEPCWDQHQFTEDEFELFKYCQFEFLKKDCKYFGTRVTLAIEELPNELYKQLTEDYIRWEKENGYGVQTDGYDIWVNDEYEPPVQECDELLLDEDRKRTLQDMKDFSKWLKELNYDPISFGSYITVAVAGNSVKIPLHADSYDLLDRFLDKAIEEY